MKMAKLRRKVADLEARLEKSRQVWKVDQESLRRLRDKHKSFEARSSYGRSGAMELRCTQCTTEKHPCATWKGLDALLQTRAS